MVSSIIQACLEIGFFAKKNIDTTPPASDVLIV